MINFVTLIVWPFRSRFHVITF